MAPETPRKRVSADRLSMATINDLNSVDSRELATQTYLSTRPRSIRALVPTNGPSYTSTFTWKSQAVKDKEEYERLRQRVRRFAPGQFKPNAKPGRGPSEIFPQNVAEWISHKKEMLAMAQAENRKNCQLLNDQIEAHRKNPKAQRKIKSVFGEGGKVFTDILTPVLAIGSIWSRENIPQAAPWPSKAELQSHTEGRECAGFLPHPRCPTDIAACLVGPGQEAPFFPQLPFDAAGPFFQNGPGPCDMYANNREMNNDPGFEAFGSFYLGSELMNEIGQWEPPFVPEWLEEQLAVQRQAMVIYKQEMMLGTPEVGAVTWQDDSFMSSIGDENQAWY